ncbi:DUF924 family protein [Asticcacaulis sp. AC402]|uniref:DUF924 family protein n=1 Tax=Asticcacaulis sp. AC402 TaxID=1282361 RepID=UPI0003C3B4F7|nr:DUF924 family protein [Asticcacaulis sp. AC402]ESQ76102.1 hypothetical protein ABAC402_06545 [Asticcacaulis sp. AC402]
MTNEQTSVIDFWFRHLTPDDWFRGGADLDDEVRRRFGDLLAAARQGQYDDWAQTPRGRLALILVLDQFSRHIHRGSPESYAVDDKAQELALDGIAREMDKVLTFAERHFFYMPLMHAEDATLQRLCVAQFTALKAGADELLAFATGHCAIVEQFGRFPHRNSVLDRDSTPEETAYLAANNNPFG